MIDFKEDSVRESPGPSQGLRPIERVVIALRRQGESYGLIGNRLGRSGAHVRRIESYALLKS